MTEHRIVIDQTGLPGGCRPQEFWSRFAPMWVDATVNADGTVTVTPNGTFPNGRHRELTSAQKRRELAVFRTWLLSGSGQDAFRIIEGGAS